MMKITYLLIGSNEGNRMQWLKEAIKQIGDKCGAIEQQSSIYQTAAWGLEDQPDFLNMALEVHTNLNTLELLKSINTIEGNLGRQRKVKWGQRTLDIDILFYNQETINTPNLIVPHPRLEERRFALLPLNEIAPNMVHPISKKTVSQLLAECTDTLDVELYEMD